MPYSAVSKITLTQSGKITLSVTVPDWEEGLPIEISGQATQENGAVATFYSVQEMNASGVLQVSDVAAAPPNKFEAGFPITVVARASEAWITMLRANTDPDALKVTEGSDPLDGAWKEATLIGRWPGQGRSWRRSGRPGLSHLPRPRGYCTTAHGGIGQRMNRLRR